MQPQLTDQEFSENGEVDIGGPSPVIAAVGVTICIRCIIESGEPTPMVVYSSRRGQVNFGDGRFSFNANGSLCIRVDTAVDGTYVCTASNIAGTTSMSITLQAVGELCTCMSASRSVCVYI